MGRDDRHAAVILLQSKFLACSAKFWSPIEAKSPSASFERCAKLEFRVSPSIPTPTGASLAVRMANEAVHLGPAPSSESYLRIDKIVDAARRHGVDAIHPGYGFLSENADFAEACAAAGIIFIGPPASAIRKMGSKTSARQVAIAAGAPVVPGTDQAIRDIGEAKKVAARLGYPVLLKAAAGGGGKGMRRVDREQDLESSLAGCVERGAARLSQR